MHSSDSMERKVVHTPCINSMEDSYPHESRGGRLALDPVSCSGWGRLLVEPSRDCSGAWNAGYYAGQRGAIVHEPPTIHREQHWV